MKEKTKKLAEVLEKEEVKFELMEGESEDKADKIDFSFIGDLTTHDIRILVEDNVITLLTWLINTVKEEKYGVLLETLNDLNREYRFVKFYAVKNEEEEGYFVMAQAEDILFPCLW